jgi:hypothetical protein
MKAFLFIFTQFYTYAPGGSGRELGLNYTSGGSGKSPQGHQRADPTMKGRRFRRDWGSPATRESHFCRALPAFQCRHPL